MTVRSWETIILINLGPPGRLDDLVGEDRDTFSVREEALVSSDEHGESCTATVTHDDQRHFWTATTDLGEPESDITVTARGSRYTARDVCMALTAAVSVLAE